MNIVLATLFLIVACYVAAECLAMVLLVFFEDQMHAFFDATVGRLIDWFNT